MNQQQERERGNVHPLDWQDEFGPLAYTQLEALVAHERAIAALRAHPAKESELCRRLGYRDGAHFERVRMTFLKYWGNGRDTLLTFAWDEASMAVATSAVERAESVERAKAAIAAEPSLAAPEAGLTVEQCGWLYGWTQSGLPAGRGFAAMRCDVATWERAYRGFESRIRADASGTLKALFSAAYHAGASGTPYVSIDGATLRA